MSLYLGVDGGGTSTSFILFNEHGEAIESISYPSLHFMSVDYETMNQGFQEVYKMFKDKGYHPEEFKIVMGLGGYGSDPVVRGQIASAVLSVFPQARLMSDSQLAMIAALNGEEGIFLISGTGSIAMYNDGHKVHRQGGFGYQIGDEGSGFWIGKKILELFTQQVDERLERNEIYDTIMKHFNMESPFELVAILNDSPKTFRFTVAGLGKLFADSEDLSIQSIYKDAGRELAKLANGFKTDGPTKIAFGGSVLNHNKLVKESCIQALNPNLELQDNENKVEYAVYILNKL